MTGVEHHRNRWVDSAQLSVSTLVVSDQRIKLILRIENRLIADCKGGNNVTMRAILDVRNCEVDEGVTVVLILLLIEVAAGRN